VRGDGEDEGAERAAHIAIGRQRGHQGETDLLGHVILVQAAGAGADAGADQPGPAVADDGGPELAQQRLDRVRAGWGILVLPGSLVVPGLVVVRGFQAAWVQQVVVVGRGSRFLAGNREVLSSRHGQLMPGWRAGVPAKRRTRTPHSYDLSVSEMLPCVTLGGGRAVRAADKGYGSPVSLSRTSIRSPVR